MDTQVASAAAIQADPPLVTPPAVEIRGVSVRYGDRPALDSVTLSVPQGQLVAIVGPNGAGKSTLFKALVDLAPLESGEVRIFGRPTRQRSAAEVSYVAQRGEFDWRFPVHVEDVALMGRYPHLGWFRRPGAADRRAARAALERVGMADLADRQIGQLSGGQQQRIFLARALAQEARLVLLDEPLSGVDAVAEQVIFDILAQLQAEGKTVLVATHDLNMALSHFSHAAALNRGLIAYGRTADVLTPEILRQTYGSQVMVLGDGPAPRALIGDGCGRLD